MVQFDLKVKQCHLLLS